MWRGAVLTLAAALIAPAGAAADGPSLTARAALVMDATTGDVLWERNGSEPLPPASTTKIMTAILALESGRLEDSFRVSEAAAQVAPSRINLRPGQRVRLKNLVYAALLNSANDAATVIAEGLAGSESAFAARMNDKARQLGARTAHFVNPHGLTAPGHVASARDLAVIFGYGLGVPLFREILATRRILVPVESPGVHWISLRSHNRLLTGYAYRVIGKTGYTRPARRCFVGAATHDDREVIVALLGATDLWGDTKRLFASAFGAGVGRSPVVMAGLAPAPRLHGARHAVPEGDDEAVGGGDAGAADTSHFVVQLGPYASHRTALATRARLARRGYAAAIVGRVLRLGSFASPARAQQLARRLRLRGYRPIVVALE